MTNFGIIILDQLKAFNLSPLQWGLFLLVALLTGAAKGGMKGIGLATVPVMAYIFGARASTGIFLPMLIIADIMAVIYYRHNVEWRYIILLLPWTVIGIFIALITGNNINENQFRYILTVVVIIMLVLLLLNDMRKKTPGVVPDNHYFAAVMGIAGGFATMIGNSAGPVFSLYFLSMNLPKKEFIGTAAWFFLIINVGKMPLHIFSWHTISMQTFLLGISTLPLIALGIIGGIYFAKLFTERAYRIFVIIATCISAFTLLF